jgi:hypothetical protein
MLGGKLIRVENLKSKISWHCPFKMYELGIPTLGSWWLLVGSQKKKGERRRFYR